MSSTLGEKLREAREERGISLSEVAEQTRISPIYLESIENDDYRNLPGGIFNKGFVKSFAKYVGVNEQEALTDYGRLMSAGSTPDEPELKVYRPEVLTDGGRGGSMVPTAIAAVIILALMTGGILFLVNYLRRPADAPVANANTKPVANSTSELPTNTETPTTSGPDMASLNVELKAITGLTVMASVDGEPPKRNNVATGSSLNFTPKESLTLNYLRWNAKNIQLSLNGKSITLPEEPLDPKDRDRIIFTISKDNLSQIWTSGSISGTPPAATPDAYTSVEPTPAATQEQRPTPLPPKPATTTAANTAAANTRATPIPAPTRKVITVTNANRPE